MNASITLAIVSEGDSLQAATLRLARLTLACDGDGDVLIPPRILSTEPGPRQYRSLRDAQTAMDLVGRAYASCARDGGSASPAGHP